MKNKNLEYSTNPYHAGSEIAYFHMISLGLFMIAFLMRLIPIPYIRAVGVNLLSLQWMFYTVFCGYLFHVVSPGTSDTIQWILISVAVL